jgi:hypothetical protein
MSRPTVICSVIVDAEAQADAEALIVPLVSRASLELQRLRWEPYPKTGAHSKLWVWLRMAEGVTGDEIKAAVDGICGGLTRGANLAGTPHNHVEENDGSFSYERILDGRKIPIVDPGVLWIHVEALFAPRP